MYYETMERVLRETDKTVVETPGVTAYLPLPEIRKRAQADNSATGGQ
jgi:membrane protease subunit HflK